MWNLDDKVTIDEIMIQYKSKYCFIRQYMPKNQLNRELKFGVLRILKRDMCRCLRFIVEQTTKFPELNALKYVRPCKVQMWYMYYCVGWKI